MRVRGETPALATARTSWRSTSETRSLRQSHASPWPSSRRPEAARNGRREVRCGFVGEEIAHDEVDFSASLKSTTIITFHRVG